MKINDISVSRNFDISKELEVISFKVLSNNQLVREPRFGVVKSWIFDSNKPKSCADKEKTKVKDQFSAFQKSMKVLFAFGLCLGLNPVSGLLQKDVYKIRFSVCSWVFMYTLLQVILQIIATCLNFYRVCANTFGIHSLGFLIFYAIVCCTSIFFIEVARKWPSLMKELSNSGLDEYVDCNIVRKCNTVSITMIILASLEHVLSIAAKTAKILDCSPNVTNYFEEYSRISSPWYYEFNITKYNNIPVDTILLFINLISTGSWSYSAMFVICISLYLTSILEQINKKIASNADKNHVPPAAWNALREDYTRATRLIRQFDDTISSIVLIAFANNLFFICLQFFNMLASRIKSFQLITAKVCPNYPSSPLLGYEYSIYVIYSVLFLLARFLALSLVTADVNTVSLKAAPAMYAISSNAYTKEVDRFLNQINNTMVALSGLQFFYVTKELVLSVAGTIVTYELVMLQFNSEDSS